VRSAAEVGNDGTNECDPWDESGRSPATIRAMVPQQPAAVDV